MSDQTSNRELPVFVISSYEVSNGILRFVEEQVQSYISEGRKVVRVSLTESSDCELSFDLRTLRGSLRWLFFALRRKRALVVLHYYNAIVFPVHDKPVSKLLHALALAVVAKRSSDSSLFFHEIEVGEGMGWRRRAMINHSLGAFRVLNFYSNAFREKVIATYPGLGVVPYVIVEHSLHMRRLFTGSKADARKLLNLSPNKAIFLCLGFIAYTKGFDLALAAFSKAGPVDAELFLVGSAGDKHDNQDYLRSLLDMASTNRNIHIANQFVDDTRFDCWIQAADVVILPYRFISSSGVGARARVYEKKLVTSDLPSLRESLPDALVFRDVDHLADIIGEFAGREKTELPQNE